MQFVISLLLLFITSVTSENGFCQKWCYRLNFTGQVQMMCCSYTQKAGMCSSPKYGLKNEIKFIQCSSDCSCPWGFKCCQNDWAGLKICVPVLEPRSNEQIKLPSGNSTSNAITTTTTIRPATRTTQHPTTTTQSRTTSKEKLVFFKTTKPETTGLPPPNKRSLPDEDSENIYI